MRTFRIHVMQREGFPGAGIAGKYFPPGVHTLEINETTPEGQAGLAELDNAVLLSKLGIAVLPEGAEAPRPDMGTMDPDYQQWLSEKRATAAKAEPAKLPTLNPGAPTNPSAVLPATSTPDSSPVTPTPAKPALGETPLEVSPEPEKGELPNTPSPSSTEKHSTFKRHR